MGVCPECGAAISMNDDVVQGEILECEEWSSGDEETEMSCMKRDFHSA